MSSITKPVADKFVLASIEAAAEKDPVVASPPLPAHHLLSHLLFVRHAWERFCHNSGPNDVVVKTCARRSPSRAQPHALTCFSWGLLASWLARSPHVPLPNQADRPTDRPACWRAWQATRVAQRRAVWSHTYIERTATWGLRSLWATRRRYHVRYVAETK